jgi:hypothetical protein
MGQEKSLLLFKTAYQNVWVTEFHGNSIIFRISTKKNAETESGIFS